MKIARKISLSLNFCGLEMQNPFMLSSAPPTGTGDMIKRAFDAGWGGAITKTLVQDKNIPTNVTPRLASLSFPGGVEEPKKMYGLENIELTTDRPLNVWLSEITDIKKNYPKHLLGASIMVDGKSRDGWQELVQKCQDAGADIIELNFSCPHGMPEKGMGAAIGQVPEIARSVTEWSKKVATVPLMVKLTPNVADIRIAGRAAVDGGADAISAINSVAAIAGIDLETLAPLPNVFGRSTHGGYSGPAIKPIALKAVSSLAKDLNVPISGVGGIGAWSDAVEFLLLGASTIQICTAVMFGGYGIIEELKDGLSGFMEDHNFDKVEDIIGKSLPYLTNHSDLDRRTKKISSINEATCVKCDRCVVSCRDAGYQALTIGADRIPKVDKERCTGCSLCAQVCPVWDCVSLVSA